ncbi:hypothetical protein AV530_003320 [Patagioenas fasciata monilis]|uniref:Uncharacterized protein n=1 Tax=Patagioenas fasciata monilis TaxID=372326 RepID=A0A1V4K203_PATFA|nr:hypothetical protein AV530_003320 [Patagioenas fasciata monilis]
MSRPGTEALKSLLEHLFSYQLWHTTPGIANTLLNKIQVTIGLNLKKISPVSFRDRKETLSTQTFSTSVDATFLRKGFRPQKCRADRLVCT